LEGIRGHFLAVAESSVINNKSVVGGRSSQPQDRTLADAHF
jgi:hypothetical protein